ncbi:O-antigen ligase family protein [Halosimplex sp. J119]
MNRWRYVGFVLILVGSLSTYTVFFRGTFLPTVLVLGSYGLFAASYLLTDNDNVVRIPRYLLGPGIMLFVGYALTIPLQPTVFYRPLVDLIIICISMLLIPQTIDRSIFFVIVRGLATGLVIIGLPAVFVGPYSLLGTTFGYPGYADLPVFPGQVFALESIYTNPNFLSVFILCGMLISLYFYDINRTNYSLFIFFVNAVGLLLTQSRSAIGVGIIAVLGYIFYKIGETPLFRLAVFTSTLVGMGALILTVTGVDPLSQISLSGRRDIWQAGISILLEKPLTGYGQIPLGPILETETGLFASPHNSYLRVFLETGIISGIGYTWIVFSILFHHIRLPLNQELVITFLLGISIAVVMIFETFVLGGIGSSSIFAAIILGYLIKDSVDYSTINGN